MPQIPLDTSCEAEYEDGYVHSETELADAASYGDGNTFTDILQKRPEADHGRMIRFSVFYRDTRYDVDWTNLPDNARPIRFRDGFSTLDTATGEVTTGWSGMRFGFQYNDPTGKNHTELVEL